MARHGIPLVPLLPPRLLPRRPALPAHCRAGCRSCWRSSGAFAFDHWLLHRFAYFGIFFFAGYVLSPHMPRIMAFTRHPWAIAVIGCTGAGVAAYSAAVGVQYVTAAAPFVIVGILGLAQLATLAAGHAWSRPLQFVGRTSIVYYVVHFPVMLLVARGMVALGVDGLAARRRGDARRRAAWSARCSPLPPRGAGRIPLRGAEVPPRGANPPASPPLPPPSRGGRRDGRPRPADRAAAARGGRGPRSRRGTSRDGHPDSSSPDGRRCASSCRSGSACRPGSTGRR